MGKNKIGNLNISKKYFGTKEIVKEVVNGATIYQKSGGQWGGTDLTGTLWNVNSVINAPSGYGLFDITFDLGSETYSEFNIGYGIISVRPYQYGALYGTISSNSGDIFASDNSWYDNQHYMFITGGTDATNTNLINWLQANATLISW